MKRSSVIHVLGVPCQHVCPLAEDELKYRVFSMEKDPVAIYHTVKLAETIGSIADHAENAGDMMRSMIARRGKNSAE